MTAHAVPAAARIREPLLLAIFAALVVVIALLVLVLVQLARPASSSGVCTVGAPCDPPSAPAGGLPGLWRSELGFQVEYLPSAWTVLSEAPSRLRLEFDDEQWMSIRGVEGAQAQALFDAELRRIRRTPGVRSLEPTNPRERRILGANLGGRPAVAGIYCAHVGAQGVNSYVELFLLAATDGGASSVVTVYTNDCDKLLRGSEVLLAADSVLNTFAWVGGT
jgi:hypothetical protein